MTEVKPMVLASLTATPLVSVVITSYNYAKFIADALDSVLSQQYTKLEIIVTDDDSTDETPQIVREYASRDPRVRLVTGDNRGQPGNTNRGFAATTGEIICFLDADDRFWSRKVQVVVQMFHVHPHHGLCLHPLQRVNGEGRPFGASFPSDIDSGWLHEFLLAHAGRCSFPATSAISIRREVAEIVFPIRSAARRVGDAYIHFPAAYLTEVCAVPEILGDYRVHNRSMTRNHRQKIDQLVSLITEYEEVFFTNQTFVADRFGDAIANRLRLTDSQDYLELLLKYMLLSGLDSYRGLDAISYVAMMPVNSRKMIWKALLRLPQPMARRVFLLGGAIFRSCKMRDA